MTSLHDVFSQLEKPGHTLVFCDETNVTDAPADAEVVPNLRIQCALVIQSDAYIKIAAAMKERLKILGPTEFHATEIVNPTKSSSWKPISIQNRLDAFDFLKDSILKTTMRILYAFVGPEQYVNELSVAAEKIKGESINMGYIAALKTVFLRSLFEQLAPMDSPVTLVFDQDKPQSSPTIELWPEGNFLFGGGPIAANSADIPGLQLADMIAFSLGRYMRNRKLWQENEPKPFDLIVLELLVNMENKFHCLLNPESASIS